MLGYIVIESFASPEEINGMRDRMNVLLDGFDCSVTSIFSTKNQKESTDDHFFESADKVSFFFEVVNWLVNVAQVTLDSLVTETKKAFDDEGKLKQSKQLSINKVGHALHEHEPVFKSFCSSGKLLSMLVSLGYKSPAIIQSMYIFKQPGIGGEVVPHQDNSFLYTNPTSCTGLWLALEDATVVNGCLWAIPGSHKNGLVRRFIRDENGVHFDCPSPDYDQKDFVSIEVKAGSLVVIHGDLIHQRLRRRVDHEPLYVSS
ncbi:hypothetical protein C5167_023034 [Papaver somniferum]|uniref:Phytanoyl-CoA dioxygenase n=1 Tax=Papaver somniferum TaxID=3469 RepID=A0A4Y7JNA9_PAPSO|nr:hypothetical protein C5167_023034 [Papaver somniferum]